MSIGHVVIAIIITALIVMFVNLCPPSPLKIEYCQKQASVALIQRQGQISLLWHIVSACYFCNCLIVSFSIYTIPFLTVVVLVNNRKVFWLCISNYSVLFTFDCLGLGEMLQFSWPVFVYNQVSNIGFITKQISRFIYHYYCNFFGLRFVFSINILYTLCTYSHNSLLLLAVNVLVFL